MEADDRAPRERRTDQLSRLEDGFQTIWRSQRDDYSFFNHGWIREMGEEAYGTRHFYMSFWGFWAKRMATRDVGSFVVDSGWRLTQKLCRRAHPKVTR